MISILFVTVRARSPSCDVTCRIYFTPGARPRSEQTYLSLNDFRIVSVTSYVRDMTPESLTPAVLSFQNDVTYVTEVDECRSDLQEVWLSLVYIYKLIIFLVGLVFTVHTRHVTLPSLRDTKQMYVVVFTTCACAMLALPTLIMAEIGMRVRFAVGGLATLIVLTTILTLLFASKVSFGILDSLPQQQEFQKLAHKNYMNTRHLRSVPACSCLSRVALLIKSS